MRGQNPSSISSIQLLSHVRLFATKARQASLSITNSQSLPKFMSIAFFDDPVDVSNLISGSSAFSKTSLNIWKFTVRILLKPGLENFKHYFASV